MRQRLIVLVGVFILIAVLIGLNAASYTQTEKIPDSEARPNRSSFNGGATGTRAFFDLLNETGRKPMRWLEPPSELDSPNGPSVLIIVGSLREEFSKTEVSDLFRWVASGKRLVVIDRSPEPGLIESSGYYAVGFDGYEEPTMMTDSYEQSVMTQGVKAATPSLPSTITQSVNAIQPSRFARSINFRRKTDAELEVKPDFKDDSTEFEDPGRDQLGTAPKPLPTEQPNDGNDEFAANPPDPVQTSPAVHFANDRKNIVVDVPYGKGNIVYVSDPYIVSNAGIRIADNAMFAINIAGTSGRVAFDEYHHGYGLNSNKFFEFFAGTPVISMFLQVFLILGLLFLSQSRRFARPVPEPEPSRLTKLEYVSAMAELQQRTRGYDLAMENIYGDFRRRAARLFGFDNKSTPRSAIAISIAERLPAHDPNEIEALMKRCEDVMHGDPSNRREIVALTVAIRELEDRLGMNRRKRATRGS